MYRLLLSAAFCLLIGSATAQPWMKNFEGKDQVKLEEVIQAYNAHPFGVTEEDADAPIAGSTDVAESHNYQFDRWCWYWAQHLDENGNMVSPTKTFQEWQNCKNRNSLSNKNAKITTSTSNWTFQGPNSSTANGKGIGRIQKVVFHPTDPNTFWVCTAGGGAWETTTNGTSWTCMTDMLPVLGVSDIAINPLKPTTIYLCTGDRDGTDNSSLGIFKSLDGGNTWNQTSFVFLMSIRKRISTILINPLDTASILITTTDGIYRSRNSGATWSQVKVGNYRDLLYRPNDTMVVYATSSAAQVFRSGDGGTNWTQVSNFTGTLSRTSIAVTPANPNIVKAIVANSDATNGTDYNLNGIFTSNDTGKTFVNTFTPASCAQNYLANRANPGISNCDGQGWYDLAIAISPTDANKMLIGGVNTWYSTNGGTSWQLANQWTASGITSVNVVHADKHYITYHPLQPNTIFECNDGGIYKTVNNPSTLGWMDLTNGLGITQFYRVAVANYADYAIGGAQDNGSKKITPSTSSYSDITGGDGMNCEMDPTSPGTDYTSIYYGTIYKNSNIISNSIPGNPKGDWITPYKISPLDNSSIVVGMDMIYLSTDQGFSWTAISPKLSSTLVKRVVFSPSKYNTIYALWGNSVRQTLNNGGKWTSMVGAPGGQMSDIVVDRTDNQHFWVTYSGYGINKVAEYDTVNGWVAINDSLPNVPINCINQDTSNGTLYVGTDIGVFYKNTLMNHWEMWSNNLPSVNVTDLDINYGTDELWISTYGRGLWKSARFVYPPSPAGVSVIPFAPDAVRISPNPNKGVFALQTYNTHLVGQTAMINILDLTGRIVWSGQQSFSAAGLLNIEANGLSKAQYIIDIIAANGMRVKSKLVIY